MSKNEIQLLLNKANDSHAAAKLLIDKGFIGFSAAQSYYTIFYLVEALLLSKGLKFSSHSALMSFIWQGVCKNWLAGPKISPLYCRSAKTS